MTWKLIGSMQLKPSIKHNNNVVDTVSVNALHKT